jgi:hypothetical protein
MWRAGEVRGEEMMVAGAGHWALAVGRQSGAAVPAGAGEVVRVVDVEGHQVGGHVGDRLSCPKAPWPCSPPPPPT